MRLLPTRFIFTIVCCTACLLASAQTFPVQSNVQLIPPYSLYLNDYVIAGQEKIYVHLLLRDVTVNDYRVKLRLRIEGAGITIATSQNFSGPPISLQGGLPLTLTSFELEPYFNLRNLDFAGLSKNEFQRTGRLPEGLYKFTLEAFDFNRTKQVAAPASAMAWIVLNDPPFINLPRNNSKVTTIVPQLIAFQWTPRHTGSPNSAFSTEYVFKLVEIWPAERNPNDAMLSQRPIFETTTNLTQIVYGPAEPQLIPGRKYAWQVTARDTQRRDLFKNQGRSEVFSFQFGDACESPENIRAVSQGTSFIRAVWGTDPVHTNYIIRYRQEGQTEWYQTEALSTQVNLQSLKPATAYEYQVQAGCGPLASDYSAIVKTTTLEEDLSQFACGAPSVPVNFIPGEPLLQGLHPGDEIFYHNYKIKVQDITSSSGGSFSGNAIAQIPYLNYAKIRMTFTNLAITQSYKVLRGEVVSVFNPDSDMVYYHEDADIDDGSPAPGDTNDTIPVPGDVVTINFDGIIDSVYVNGENEIVIVDDAGAETTYERKVDEETGDRTKTVIVDAGGASYTVSENGAVTEETSLPDNTTGSTDALASIPPEFAEEFALAFIDHYVDQLSAYLTANPQYEKGPNATDIVKPELEDLPDCLQTRQGDLSYIKRYLVHLKADAEDRPYFTKWLETKCVEYVEGLIKAREQRNIRGNENKPIKDLIGESDWNIIVQALCEFVVGPAKEYHVEKNLSLFNEDKFSECFERGLDKAMEEFFTAFDLAVQAGWIEMGLCLTEKGSCGSSYMQEFTCGAVNALIQELDVLAISQGGAQILISQLKNRFECLINNGGPIGIIAAESMAEEVHLFSKCVLGVNLTLDEWTGLYDTIQSYVSYNWTDPYYHGQATVFVATIAIPITKLSKTKLITRLSALEAFSAHTDDLT
ncbi:MAG TPA: fibronectin type III domain-containing protein, partial [Ohtaekwangia sp.]|nr:fibronectin type III domain-containing protein [Ohtaekwangia sp.]